MEKMSPWPHDELKRRKEQVKNVLPEAIPHSLTLLASFLYCLSCDVGNMDWHFLCSESL